MSTTAAAQLARLRIQFRDWHIVRTQCGTFIARHRITGELMTTRTLAELEELLNERASSPRRPAAG
jgi:hypothetical protein